MKRLNAVSLFSCIGVSDFYLRDLGIDVVVASDIDKKRCELYHFFHPETEVVCGDISQDSVKTAIKKATHGRPIDIVISTPPCQGLSSVGKNRSYHKLITAEDERNYLILESFKIIDALKPSYILFENVPRLLKVLLPYKGKVNNIEEILNDRLGKEYQIKIDIFNTCDYEVPQSRERVFIRLFKKGLAWTDPVRSEHIITLQEAIGDLPSLEPGDHS